jgi:hypothetical protein
MAERNRSSTQESPTHVNGNGRLDASELNALRERLRKKHSAIPESALEKPRNGSARDGSVELSQSDGQ